tara:strand:- start:492 stop:911 length:420 start_codon:yes stop_codon:yes gene_type:complete
MPDAKTFYPGSSASNPISNATTAAVGNAVDDENSATNITFISSTSASAPFRFTNGGVSGAPSSASSLTITSADILANSFSNGDTVYVSDNSRTNVEKVGTVSSAGAGTVTITMGTAFTSSDTTNYTVGKRVPGKLYITY